MLKVTCAASSRGRHGGVFLAANRVVTGLDVGSAKICALVAEIGPTGEYRILGTGVAPSKGIRRGMVVDLDKCSRSIAMAVDRAQQMSGRPVHEVYVAISGDHIKSLNNHGVVTVSDLEGEITEDDVARALEAAGLIQLEPGREVLHTATKQFIVDNYEGILDPVGLVGKRLEVEVHIITAATAALENLIRAVNRAGLAIEDIILSSLASAAAILLEAERELGVVIADVGGGTTDLAVFKEGSLIDTAVLPLGGGHITSDLAYGLGTPLGHAEKVKHEVAVALATLCSEKQSVTVPTVGGQAEKSYECKYVAEIVEPRVQEILGLIDQHISLFSSWNLLPGGLVVTGGGSCLRGMAEIVERDLGVAVRIGIPQEVDGFDDIIGHPAFSTAVGLVLLAARDSHTADRRDGGDGILQAAVNRLKSLLGDFI